MADKVLIDTNVLLDYLLTREPFYKDAEKIIHDCVRGKVKGCIAAHSVTNMFFILRKDYNSKERREILISLFSIFDVEGIDKTKLLLGLQNYYWDFKMKTLLTLKIVFKWNVQDPVAQNIL